MKNYLEKDKMNKYTQKDIARFFSKVQKQHGLNDCWIWTAGKGTKGYGIFSMRHKDYKAHRVSYEIHFGYIPEGLLVCHKCDNPSCVNPSHLFTGTHQDNVDDKNKKGRARYAPPFGEKHGMHKLVKSQVEDIRKIYLNTKISQAKLGKQFSVSQSEIHNIVNYKNWK